MAFAEAKKVYQWTMGGELVEEYKSVTFAAQCTGASSGNISLCANNKLFSTGGYRWTYSPTIVKEEPPKRGSGWYMPPMPVRVSRLDGKGKPARFPSVISACRALPNLTGFSPICNGNVFKAIKQSKLTGKPARCGGYLWELE